MIADKYVMRSGIGASKEKNRLPSFDKALIEAGVGNYNLVRLSSILPAECELVDEIGLPEGSLLPTAYSTITSCKAGEKIASAVGVGICKDDSKVGVIMEFSDYGKTADQCKDTVTKMIQEAFDARGWNIKEIKTIGAEAEVGEGETVTTFACIAEWWD